MPRVTRTRTVGNEVPQQPAEGAETAPKLTDTVTKKLKKVMGIENISISKPILMGALQGEPRAQRLAELVLIYLGYVAGATELKEAGDRWGRSLWQEWRGIKGAEAIADWEMVHALAGIEVVQVSSGKDVKVPAGLIVDKIRTMVVAMSAGNYFFVVLSPSRIGEGRIEDFVSGKLQAGNNEKGQKRVIRIDEEVEEEEVRSRKEKRGRLEEDFRVVEEHPVLESFEEFEKFRKDMRRIKVQNAIEWSEFIGEEIFDQVSFIYRAQFKTEIEFDQLSKSDFLTRLEVCVNVYAPTAEQSVSGEPWLHEEPELVPKFAKEFMRYCQGIRGSKLEKVDRLLRAVEKTHRDWSEAMYRDIAMFRVEENGDLCLVRAIRKLQELGKEAMINKERKQVRVREENRGERMEGAGNGARGDYEYGGGRASNGARGIYEYGGGRTGNGGRGNYEYGGGRPGNGGRGNYEYGGGRAGNGGGGVEFGGGRGGNGGGRGVYNARGDYERGGDWHQDQQQRNVSERRDDQGQGGNNWVARGAGGGTAGGTSGYARNTFGSPDHRWQRRNDEEEVRNTGIACYNCGDPSHLSPKCPKPRMCGKCGSTKHLRLQCDGSGPQDMAKAEEKSEPAGGAGTAAKQYVPPVLGTKATARIAFQPQGAAPTK